MTDPDEPASTTPPADSSGSESRPLEVTLQGQPASEDPLRPTQVKRPFVPGQMEKRDCLNCQKTVETRSGYCPVCGKDLREPSPGELFTRSGRTDAVLGFLTVMGLVALAFGVSVCLGLPFDREGYVGLIVFSLSIYLLTPIVGILVPVILQRRLRWRRPAYVRGLYWGTVVVTTLVFGAYAVCGGLWIRGSL